MESRTKNSTRNIVYGIVQRIISIFLPFIVRSVFIYKFGKEYLGLDSLFVSLLQVLNLTELGFGNALVYSMYKPIVDNDTNKICSLLNFYKKCYRVIGFIVLIIGIIITPFLNLLISGSYPEDINIYIVYFIFLINTVLSYFLFAYKNSLLIAHQRMDIGRKVTLVLDVFKNGIQFVVIFLIKNYYLYALILPIVTILNNVIIAIISNKYYPRYQPKGKIERIEFSNIKKNVKGMFFQKLGGIATKNADNIVISAMLGLGTLGVYNNYYYILTAVTSFFSIIIESIKPSVGNSVVKENLNKNYKDFKMLNFLSLWIVTWASCCLSCLIDDFIFLWIGQEMQLPRYIAVVFGIYFFILHWCDILYVYQEANGLWWENRYTQLFTAIANFMLNIILVKSIGILGILLSTIITVILITDIGYAKVLFQKYFNKKEYFKKYLLSQGKGVIIALIAFIPSYYLCNILKDITLMNFILKIIIVMIVPNVIILFCNFKSDSFRISMKFLKDKFLNKLIKN